ncbi:MAG: hypothetical protein GX376_07000 [Firmicutes bacterium]|nr:hypothetical protein [Bacillota bacterium]
MEGKHGAVGAPLPTFSPKAIAINPRERRSIEKSKNKVSETYKIGYNFYRNKERGDALAKIDMPSKRLIQLRPNDWVKLALKTSEDILISEMKPDKIPRVESRLDSLFWIEDHKGKFILNIEPQGYYDASLAVRMLRYRSDIWEYTMSEGKGMPSIKQVVIFFYPKDDNKLHELKDERNDDSGILFSYDVIRIWEIKGAYIIDNKLKGLYSLLPLTEAGPGETSEGIIEKTVKAIETIEDKSLRGDSLAAMSILSADKYSSTLIKKHIRREMLVGSPLFEEWVREERKEAAEKAIIKNAKSNILEILVSKFDFIPKDIRMGIEGINDFDILDGLFKKTIKIEDIEDFRRLMDKAIKIMKGPGD